MMTLRTWSISAASALCVLGIAAQGGDPKAEMILFVQGIAAHARAAEPAFGVFPQNASDLGGDSGYLACVTGMGQEDTYYGYKKDGKATPPDVTAQTESNLDVFRAAGKLVLTVDYPFKDTDVPTFNKKARKKIDTVYVRAQAKAPCANIPETTPRC